MSAKNDISARFIEAYEALLIRKDVSDKRDFATKLGISASMVTEISKGRSSVGTSAIQNMVSQLNVSAEWLLTGRGEMFTDESTTIAKQQPVIADERLVTQGVTPELITELLNRITEQAAEIGRLQEQIRQMTIEKEKHVSDAPISGTANVG